MPRAFAGILKRALLMMILIPGPAFARPLHPPSGPDPDPTPLVRDEPLAEFRERRFDYNRRGKTAQLAVELFGVGSRGFQQALRVGAFLSQNWILELQGGQGGAALYGDVYMAKSYVFGQLSLKYFFGNALYVYGGGAYERLQAKDFSWTADARFIGESGSVVLGLGHQWQWNTFTMGCDWASVGWALNPRLMLTESSGTLTSVQQSRFAKEQNDYDTQNLLYYLARFYIGFSF